VSQSPLEHQHIYDHDFTMIAAIRNVGGLLFLIEEANNCTFARLDLYFKGVKVEEVEI